jgi:UDP-glucose 4-epimerase
VTSEAAGFRARRVLITGGLGFIGSALAHTLVDAGANVTIVDSLAPECGGNYANVDGIEAVATIVEADVRDVSRLAELVDGSEFIFNLAGHTSHIDSMNAPQVDLQLNCAAQLSLLEACRHARATPAIVFAGTRQIYGRPRYLPVDESHPIEPVDVNGIHKAAGEQYHLLYGAQYDLPVAVLRLTNTYGPRMYVRDARQTFLGIWIRELVQGRPFEIWGDGTQRRDFTFIDDAIAALLLAVDPRANGRSLNLGGDRPVTLNELADLALSANGGGSYSIVPFPEDRKRIDVGDYVADYGAIRELLGWHPMTSLEDGLRRTLEYYREHGERYW